MSYKIEIDKGKCVGCGACEAACPEVYELKKGKSVAKKSKIEELGCAKEAADVCPVEAIKITKEE